VGANVAMRKQPEIAVDRRRALGTSKAFAIPKRDGNTVTERIQKIVFSLALFVPYTETFNLIEKVIS
jgi:hypothetical protein